MVNEKDNNKELDTTTEIQEVLSEVQEQYTLYCSQMDFVQKRVDKPLEVDNE